MVYVPTIRVLVDKAPEHIPFVTVARFGNDLIFAIPCGIDRAIAAEQSTELCSPEERDAVRAAWGRPLLEQKPVGDVWGKELLTGGWCLDRVPEHLRVAPEDSCCFALILEAVSPRS